MSRLSGFTVHSTTPSSWNVVVAGTIELLLIDAPGAKPGDFCIVSVECSSIELADGTFSAQVTADNEVGVAFNPTENTDGMSTLRPVHVKVIPADAI